MHRGIRITLAGPSVAEWLREHPDPRIAAGVYVTRRDEAAGRAEVAMIDHLSAMDSAAVLASRALARLADSGLPGEADTMGLDIGPLDGPTPWPGEGAREDGMVWGCEDCDVVAVTEPEAVQHSDAEGHSLALRPAHIVVGPRRSRADEVLGAVRSGFPRFTHDCDTCEYLGHVADHDVYLCPQGGIATVVARYGNDGPEYSSGRTVHFGERAGHDVEMRIDGGRWKR